MEPVTDGPWVFESPHVSALMDIGQARMALEEEAKEAGASRFGEGYHDFVNNRSSTPEFLAELVGRVMDQDPTAWASIVNASRLVAQGSQTHEELLNNVKHLAVLVVAWLEDVQNRNVVGIEP